MTARPPSHRTSCVLLSSLSANASRSRGWSLATGLCPSCKIWISTRLRESRSLRHGSWWFSESSMNWWPYGSAIDVIDCICTMCLSGPTNERSETTHGPLRFGTTSCGNAA
jgi:hypothetical protein